MRKPPASKDRDSKPVQVDRQIWVTLGRRGGKIGLSEALKALLTE